MGDNSGQHLTAAGKYPRLDPMAASDTLAALLNRQLEALGFSVADAARKTGLSYRQMYRLCTDKSHHIQPLTVGKLERLGLDRRALALAAYSAVPAEPAGTEAPLRA